MQKSSNCNMAIIRLRFFSYTTVGGVRTLYPLRVSMVRSKWINLSLSCSSVLLFCFTSCSCCTWKEDRVQISFLCVILQYSTAPLCGNLRSCVSFTAVSWLTCCWHLYLKQVRKGKSDSMIQAVPQPLHPAGFPHARPLSIPIVLPLTSEVRSPSPKAPVPPARCNTPDIASQISHPTVGKEAPSRSVIYDHFEIYLTHIQKICDSWF